MPDRLRNRCSVEPPKTEDEGRQHHQQPRGRIGHQREAHEAREPTRDSGSQCPPSPPTQQSPPEDRRTHTQSQRTARHAPLLKTGNTHRDCGCEKPKSHDETSSPEKTLGLRSAETTLTIPAPFPRQHSQHDDEGDQRDHLSLPSSATPNEREEAGIRRDRSSRWRAWNRPSTHPSCR